MSSSCPILPPFSCRAPGPETNSSKWTPLSVQRRFWGGSDRPQADRRDGGGGWRLKPAAGPQEGRRMEEVGGGLYPINCICNHLQNNEKSIRVLLGTKETWNMQKWILCELHAVLLRHLFIKEYVLFWRLKKWHDWGYCTFHSWTSLATGSPEKPEHHHGNGLIHQPVTSEREAFPSLDLLELLGLLELQKQRVCPTVDGMRCFHVGMSAVTHVTVFLKWTDYWISVIKSVSHFLKCFSPRWDFIKGKLKVLQDSERESFLLHFYDLKRCFFTFLSEVLQGNMTWILIYYM